MTLRRLLNGAFYLPARALTGLTELLLGSYLHTPYRNGQPGTIVVDADGVAETDGGILGRLLNGVNDVLKGISNFIYNHQKAIASAFWASFALAGAAALTVFLWPAALTAVATFTIAGYSIANVFGAGLAAQVGGVAAVTAAATSAAVYTVATIANAINWCRGCSSERNPGRKAPLNGVPVYPASSSSSANSSAANSSSASISRGLSSESTSRSAALPRSAAANSERAPVQFASPIATASSSSSSLVASAPAEAVESKSGMTVG